ncbi:phage tail protein [Microbulbifer litoralis]|uniref:phage tail protein n=1 Tax=Microbulbifer litoralis TaxID=2933965 RepID=UPI00202976CF|nr:tail fiber protein [Microbulbifer sp. GX H0434]
MEPFIGEIRLLPYTLVPRGWALCDGQLLPISQNTALFSLIGTTYGGNGTTTFALPNLKGRVAPGAGRGPGLQSWDLGAEDGTDSVTLTAAEMPQHHHSLRGLDISGDTDQPSENAYLGQDSARGGQGNVNFLARTETPPDATLTPEALTLSGESRPHENRQPFLAVKYCIALTGIFPPRG